MYCVVEVLPIEHFYRHHFYAAYFRTLIWAILPTKYVATVSEQYVSYGERKKYFLLFLRKMRATTLFVENHLHR